MTNLYSGHNPFPAFQVGYNISTTACIQIYRLEFSFTEKPVTSTQCPTAIPVTVSMEPYPSCPAIPVLGTGIGLSLTPKEADDAIEVLFGISLSLACLLIILLGIYFYQFRYRQRMYKNALTEINEFENLSVFRGDKEADVSAL